MSSVMVNLTLHEVVVYDGDRPLARWAPAGVFARIEERTESEGHLDTDQGTVPTILLDYGSSVLDLPDPQEGRAYIVSRVLAATVRRPDVYFPAGEVRDDAGRIIGCRALGRFTPTEVPDA